MKREIKFRGKRVDCSVGEKPEWVYGYYFRAIGKYFILPEYSPTSEFNSQVWVDGFIEVHPESVGQFTGLNDKKGVEIYEGDILTNGDIKIKYVVEWLDGGLRGRQASNESWIGLDYWIKGIEVIGNTTDNPKLLK